jgi:hypothetical protein
MTLEKSRAKNLVEKNFSSLILLRLNGSRQPRLGKLRWRMRGGGIGPAISPGWARDSGHLPIAGERTPSSHCRACVTCAASL